MHADYRCGGFYCSVLEQAIMKTLGFMFLPMGCVILMLALVLFPHTLSGGLFCLSGFAVQIAGLGFLFSAMRGRDRIYE